MSLTDLYTEAGDAPDRSDAKSEQIGNTWTLRNADGRDAAPAECIDLLNSPHQQLAP
jgi:hypothetical protein